MTPSRARPLVRAAAPLVAAAALAGSGCGEDRSHSVSTETDPAPAARPAPAQRPAEAPPAKVSVVLDEYRLDPARIRVDRPATLAIAVRNRGKREHALAVRGPGVDAATAALGPGGRATLTVELERPGRYRWYCPIGDHAGRGMRGTIEVAKTG